MTTNAFVDLETMADVQSSKDRRKVKIEKVGIKKVKVPIKFFDIEEKAQNTISEISLYVDLEDNVKGTHMSRFLEVLRDTNYEVSINSIPDFLFKIRSRLNSKNAFCKIDFPYILEKTSPITEAKGYMSYNCSIQGSSGDINEQIIEVNALVTTLCPCSKELSYAGAHNQRGEVKVKIKSDNDISIREIIEYLETAASSPLYPVLKRQDEKFVTEKAYENPRFVEDLLREIVVQLRTDVRIHWFELHVENFESIHAHNAYAYTEEYN